MAKKRPPTPNAIPRNANIGPRTPADSLGRAKLPPFYFQAALLPNSGETTSLARCGERPGHSGGRLFSFFSDLLRARIAPAARLEQSRHRPNECPRDRLAQGFRVRLSRGGSFHCPQWLSADGIDGPPSDRRPGVLGNLVSRAPPPLSDVLGRAPCLPCLAVRRASGAGG